MNLHDVAEVCDRIAADNGFAKPTWETLPVKLAFVITELDEARDGAMGSGGDPLSEELADIAIRLLSSLHAIWGKDWGDRVTHRKKAIFFDTFRSIESLLWPTLGHVSKAIEKWRFDDRNASRMHMELALLQLFRLADGLSIDLDVEIANKCAKNRDRKKLHGKVRDEG